MSIRSRMTGTVSRRRVPATIATLVVALIAFEVPQFYGPVVTFKIGQFLILAIAILGVNLLTGYTGQISIGHSAFFGVGAYGTAILAADAGWPLIWAVITAIALAFVLGALCGFPALRIKGLYLGLVTLALATVFPAVLNKYPSITGGPGGKQNVPSLHAPAWSGLADDQWICYVLIVGTAVVYLLTKLGVSGRTGRALKAIREDELAASVYGVNLAKYKVGSFAVSAAITAFAGCLFTLQGNLLASNSANFTITGSINFLAGAVIGGAGTIVGSLIGGAVAFYLPDALSNYNTALAPLLYGALLVAIMLLMPSGITGLAKKAWHFIENRYRSRPAHSRPDSEDTAPVPSTGAPVSADMATDANLEDLELH